MKEENEITTEYRAKFVPLMGMHDKTSENYEKIVAKMMETCDSQTVTGGKPKPTRSLDKYEAIVQRKMHEHDQEKDRDLHAEQSENVEEQVKFEAPPEPEKQPEEKESKKSEDPHEENVQKPSRGPRKTFRAAKAINRISSQTGTSSATSPTKTKPAKAIRHTVHRRVRPIREKKEPVQPLFFRDPDHATPAEQQHLYGPFYVSWPKNKPMPSSYAELAKIYGRRYQ